MSGGKDTSWDGLWEFNRRRVVDQEIYVRAETLAEAWRKARAGEVEESSDDQILKITLRRSKDGLTP